VAFSNIAPSITGCPTWGM